jgi:hypothetical protein
MRGARRWVHRNKGTNPPQGFLYCLDIFAVSWFRHPRFLLPKRPFETYRVVEGLGSHFLSRSQNPFRGEVR